MRSISRRLSFLPIALAALASFDAHAVSFGPYAITPPSSIASQDLSIELTPTGTITFEIANVPHLTPQLFEITQVSLFAGPLHFTLDPTLASPALGVIQPDGRFLIPTLFLRGNDGGDDFDLAIPNVQGVTLGAPTDALGLFAQFQVSDGLQIFDVAIYANVPEPGTAVLLSLGCAALALRARKEIAR